MKPAGQCSTGVPPVSVEPAGTAAHPSAGAGGVPPGDTARDEISRLRAAILDHHAQKADDRCIEDDDRLYAAAGLPPCDRRVGDKVAMLANCKRFIERRCEGGHWPSYRELEAERDALRRERDALLQRTAFIDEGLPEAMDLGEDYVWASLELTRRRAYEKPDICRMLATLKAERDTARKELEASFSTDWQDGRRDHEAEPKDMAGEYLVGLTFQLYARACDLQCTRQLHERAFQLVEEVKRRVARSQPKPQT